MNLYLDLPAEEDQLNLLARAANESAWRSVKRLDEAIAYLDRILKGMRREK